MLWHFDRRTGDGIKANVLFRLRGIAFSLFLRGLSAEETENPEAGLRLSPSKIRGPPLTTTKQGTLDLQPQFGLQTAHSLLEVDVMTGQVQLDGLLLTRDMQVVSIMNPILGNFAIDTEVCGELDSALDAVTHRRLDTVIVDWDGVDDPSRVVRAARKSSPNCNSTIVAMVKDGSETHALLVGANFMIHKPMDFDHANRCMRAAYGTMLQNRRRAARVTIDLPVIARIVNGAGIEARISDISVGGLALQSKQPLQINQEVLAQFSLPGFPGLVHVTGKVVNANASGRAGLRFSFVPDEDLSLLEDWLAVELAKLEKAEMPVYHAN